MDEIKHWLDLLLRWGHVLSAIIWMGFLFFFNFVNGPMSKTLDAETKKKVVPELMYRCLFWFRWGAMSTLLFGLGLFFWLFYGDGTGAGVYKNFATDELFGRSHYIMGGMTLGIVMWFNVWFVIWPAQKGKILPAVAAGQAPPAGVVKRATLFSRINTYLSGPMLMMMFAAHQPSAKMDPVNLAIEAAIAVTVLHLLIKLGATAGKPPTA